MIKKVLFAFLTLLILLVVWQWPLLRYGFEQGKGQFEVIVNAKPLDEFLNDPNFPDSLKNKISIAQQARSFAINDLGLNESDNYTKLYDQKGEVLLWNLSACAPYSFTPYEWEFPFLGSMPYKGFFDLEKAKKEEAKLKQDSLDTRIRPVGGWSTLGILNDPILSNMLHRSDGALAEVIIHELTHATIFIKNNVSFNENLASFIGEKGAELFLKKQFSDQPEMFLNYIESEEDSQKFRTHMLSGTKKLDSLYNSLQHASTDSMKEAAKSQMINQIVEALDTINFNNTRYKHIFENQLPNNAYFMSLMRYHSQKDTLNSIYKSFNKDIKLMISSLKNEYAK